MHHELIKKRVSEPDEVRSTEKAQMQLLEFGDKTLMRAVMEPGWHWAEHVKPVVGTETCQVAHLNFVLSGHLRVRLDDGKEMLLERDDFAYIPPGHDAWVEGEEPFVVLDLMGGETYGRRIQEEREAA